MQIADIYLKYSIPPNLQNHMFRVAAVGACIVDYWDTSGALDRKAIITALLFHDTGNIIKYDFRHVRLMGEEAKRVDYWRKVQKEFREKYQNDEHVATREIAEQVGINKQSMELLRAVGSSRLQKAVESIDWSVKIVNYSDFRVDPLGVVTVDKRFDDIIERYKGRDHELGRVEETEARRARCLKLEAQLQLHVKISLPTIDNNSIAQTLDEVRQFEIEVESR